MLLTCNWKCILNAPEFETSICKKIALWTGLTGQHQVNLFLQISRGKLELVAERKLLPVSDMD